MSKPATALAAERLAAAKLGRVEVADPQDPPTFKHSKNFLIVSNLPEGELEDVSQAAEQRATALAKQFHATPDQPLVKGGITLFVFRGRYDYSEFGLMVEHRKLPKKSYGHWYFDMVDAYAAIVPPADAHEYSLDGILQQQLVALYLASLPGKPPIWFADGSGHALAAQLNPDCAQVHEWNDRLHDLAGTGKFSVFDGHNLSGDESEVAAYGFANVLLGNFAKYTALVSALRGGESFDMAFPHHLREIARSVGGRLDQGQGHYPLMELNVR